MAVLLSHSNEKEGSGGSSIAFGYLIGLRLFAVPIVDSQSSGHAMEPYIPSM
jgi:hypothetical protein